MRSLSGTDRAVSQAAAAVRVFFGNLPFSVTAEQLRELIVSSGLTPQRVDVARKPSGESRGYGFANIQEKDVARALELHGRSFGGRPLCVERPRPVGKVTFTETGRGMTRIYIGGLRAGAREKDVRELLAGCGAGVTGADVEMGPRHSAERPFAFVKVPLRQAKDLIESLNGTVIFGMKLRAGPALGKFRQRAFAQESESEPK